MIFSGASATLPGKGLEASLVPLSCTIGDDDPPYSLAHFSALNSVVSDRHDGQTDSDLVMHFADVRAHGIVLAGAEVTDTFARVSFVAFVDSLLCDYEWMTSPQRLDSDPIYAVFNMCRLLVVAATQRVTTIGKIEGALMALKIIDEPYRALVEAALESYATPRTSASNIIVDPTTLRAFIDTTNVAAEALRSPEVVARRAAASKST